MNPRSGDEAGGAPDPAGHPRAERTGADRRRSTIPRLRFLVFGGRRRSIRRAEDQKRIIILDRYRPRILAAIVGILCLSLIDAFLTLTLIEHGASEINPVMAYFLSHGPVVFTCVKYLLTSLAVVIFLLVNNSVLPGSRFRPPNLFAFAIVSFAIVVVWEITLILVIASRA